MRSWNSQRRKILEFKRIIPEYLVLTGLTFYGTLQNIYGNFQ